MNSKQEIKYEIVNSDVLKIFVIVFSFFTLLGCIRLYYMFNGQTIGDVIRNIYPYLAVTNNTMHNLTRPWVLFTHMGSEVSVMGMLSNFLWLYMFGFIIQDLKGKSSVWPLFVFAGVVSAIVVCIAVAVKSSTLQSGFYYGMRPSIVAIAVAAVAF